MAGSYLAGQSGGALVFDLFPSVWADGESVMNADGTEATLDNDSMKAVLDAYKELANTTNGLGAGSKEETGATWTAPFANGNIGVMPYPNTSSTALFEAEKDGGFEVGRHPDPGHQGRQDLHVPRRRCHGHLQGLQARRSGLELPSHGS